MEHDTRDVLEHTTCPDRNTKKNPDWNTRNVVIGTQENVVNGQEISSMECNNVMIGFNFVVELRPF